MRSTALAVTATTLFAACGGSDKGGTPGADTATASAAIAVPIASVPARGATGKTVEVRMTGDGTTYKFDPADFTIKAGDNVRFIMTSGGPHDVAFDRADIPAAAAPQLSANMPNQIGELMGPLLSNPNETYDISFAGVRPGVYYFHCTPHVAMGMKGIIIVTP